nr:hypothetical protein L203_03835 [Cryptococcus depauperatus CBS 7841]
MSAPTKSNGLSATVGEKSSLNTQSLPKIVFAGKTGRILCVADIRGDYHELNRLIREHDATAVIHTGDFGFMTTDSVERMGDKILRHLIQYSPLLPQAARTQLLNIPQSAGRLALINQLNNSSVHFPLSQFPHLLSGAINFPVPVFTTWGLVEDVKVIEKFRTGEYEVQNLAILDEATSRLVEVGGVKLRLLGLGGTVANHKLCECSLCEGHGSIAGAQGTMWTTALQIGELIDTAQRSFSSDEVRLFVSTAPISRNGLMTLVANALRADLTISCGLHFRYPVSYNEFSINPDFDSYRKKLQTAKDSFNSLFEQVRDKVLHSLDQKQNALLQKTLSAIEHVPITDDGMWTNTWHWGLSDVGFGNMLLSIADSRVSSEVKSSGSNFSHRIGRGPAPPSGAATAVTSPALPASSKNPTIRPPVVSNSNSATPIRPPMGPSASGMKPNSVGPSGRLPVRPNMAPGVNNFPTRPHIVPRNGRGFNSNNSGGGSISQSQAFKEAQVAVQVEEKSSITSGSEGQKKKEDDKIKDKKDEQKEGVKIEDQKATVNGEKKDKITDRKEAKQEGKKDAKGEKKEDAKEGNNPWDFEDSSVLASGEIKDESGTKTPEESRPKKYSLYCKGLPTPTTEDELKGLFGEAADKITQVKVIFDGLTKKQKDFGYLDFDSEEAMNEALKAAGSSIRDTPINVSISKPHNRPSNFGTRGRGGFRGKGRGGFSGLKRDREGSGSAPASGNKK